MCKCFQISFLIAVIFYLEMHADFTDMFIVLASVNKNSIEHNGQLFIIFVRKIDIQTVCIDAIFIPFITMINYL